MNTNILKITIAMLVIVTTIGCEKTHKDIDSKIIFSIVEEYDESPRTFQMKFLTTKIYSDACHQIDLLWNKSSNTIDISFLGVFHLSGGCATVLSNC